MVIHHRLSQLAAVPFTPILYQAQLHDRQTQIIIFTRLVLVKINKAQVFLIWVAESTILVFCGVLQIPEILSTFLTTEIKYLALMEMDSYRITATNLDLFKSISLAGLMKLLTRYVFLQITLPLKLIMQVMAQYKFQPKCLFQLPYR